MIAGLRVTGMAVPFVIEVSVNTAAFEGYVEQVLAPTLRIDDIVILDNVHRHHTTTVVALSRLGVLI